MSNEDTADNAPVEPIEAPQEETSSPEPKEDSQEDQKEPETPEAEEPKEETPEEKLARLERLEEKTQAAQKKISAQRKHIASLQKAQQERDAKLRELESQQRTETPEPEKPQLDQYDSYEDYEKATEEYVDKLAEFRAKDKYQKEQQEQLVREAQEARLKTEAERSRQYESQKKTFLEVAPDYVDSEAEFNDYIQTAMQKTDPYVQDAIVTQAYRNEEVSAPELIHYFGANNGANLDELEAISQLRPTEAAVEIYKIQQKLKSHPKKREKVEALPKPPSSVKGSSSKSKSLSSMSGKELLKWASS